MGCGFPPSRLSTTTTSKKTTPPRLTKEPGGTDSAKTLPSINYCRIPNLSAAATTTSRRDDDVEAAGGSFNLCQGPRTRQD